MSIVCVSRDIDTTVIVREGARSEDHVKTLTGRERWSAAQRTKRIP